MIQIKINFRNRAKLFVWIYFRFNQMDTGYYRLPRGSRRQHPIFEAVLPEELDEDEDEPLTIENKRVIIPNVRCPCDEPCNEVTVPPRPTIPPLPEVKAEI